MNNFVRADLSSYETQDSKKFYANLFGWTYDDIGDGDYFLSSCKGKLVGAVFTTPEFLQKIHMPSFWMSYISVENVDDIIIKAKKHDNVIIEIGPIQGFDSYSRVALIRDPSGAGFTIVEGMKMPNHRSNGHGCVTWNELYLQSVYEVKSFYEDLFGWEIQQERGINNRYTIANEGRVISMIQELPNEVRSEKKRWSVFFAVDDINQAKKDILEYGGKIIDEYDTVYGRQVSAYDSQGASFMLVELYDDENYLKRNKERM